MFVILSRKRIQTSFLQLNLNIINRLVDQHSLAGRKNIPIKNELLLYIGMEIKCIFILDYSV